MISNYLREKPNHDKNLTYFKTTDHIFVIIRKLDNLWIKNVFRATYSYRIFNNLLIKIFFVPLFNSKSVTGDSEKIINLKMYDFATVRYVLC